MMGQSSNQTDRPLIGLDDDTDVSHNFRQIPDIGGSTSRSQPPRFSPGGSSGVWGAVESQSYGPLGSSRTNYHESGRDDVYNEATVADVERIVRKYTGDLLVAMDNLSLRFSQFEDKTSYIENSMKELKISIGNNAGATDGKLRQLENILREVKNEVHDMHDRQEIAEAQLQLQLTKLRTFKVENQAPSNSRQQSTQEQQQTPPSTYSVPPAPNESAPPPQQQSSFMQERPIQTQCQSQETRYPQYQSPFQAPPPLAPSPPVAPLAPPPRPLAPPSHQQQHYGPPPLPSTQQQYEPPPLPSTQQQYEPPPLPSTQQQYGPPPQVTQYCPPIASSPPQPPLPRYHEDTPPYISESRAYPSNTHQPTAPTQPLFMPPSSQFYSPGSDTFESSTYRTSFPDRYGQGGYATGPRPASYFASDTLSGLGIYQQSPIAEVIPRARPTVPDTESSDAPSVEEIVNRVASMGFSKGQARATVNKMSENGQSVDLNAVLDKLTNEGDIMQPHEIWRKE